METFKREPKTDEIKIIPIIAKFRVKLQSNGMVDKLKTRWCLRRDKQKERTDFDTWCAIASFWPLRKLLASSATKKCRIYQLDFIGAFLQSHTERVTVAMLPKEFEQLLPKYAEWFGTLLRLVKAQYGDATANKC